MKRSIAVAAMVLACANQGALAAQPGPLLDRYGPTQEGDTFWRIAERLQASSSAGLVRLHRRLIRDNPDAYLDGGPDRLRLGVMLDVRGPVPLAARGWESTSTATPRVTAAPRASERDPSYSMQASAPAKLGDDMDASTGPEENDPAGSAYSMEASVPAEAHHDMAASKDEPAPR